jgi:hypothetical protein
MRFVLLDAARLDFSVETFILNTRGLRLAKPAVRGTQALFETVGLCYSLARPIS